MNYTNHVSRLRLQNESGPAGKPPTFLSLELGPRGLRLCVRTAATLAKRGITSKLLDQPGKWG